MKEPEDFELVDIKDQADEVGKLTPSDYAKLRSITPQLIYYYLRTKVLTEERCLCGRKVVDVRTADAALQEKKSKRGRKLETKPNNP